MHAYGHQRLHRAVDHRMSTVPGPRGEGRTALWMCLSCGWVACSDDSPNQHARAHYEETDHPVAARLPRGSHTLWCHVHRRAV